MKITKSYSTLNNEQEQPSKQIVMKINISQGKEHVSGDINIFIVFSSAVVCLCSCAEDFVYLGGRN